MIFSEMIDGGKYHDLSQPSFKGAHYITISRTIIMQFAENLKEAIVEYLNCVLLIICISVTDSHGISVERAIDLFLALSVVQGAAPNV